MKTFIRSYMVLVLGAFVFSGAYGQNNSAEYDDMYYIPSEKKSAPVQKKQEPATPKVQADEPDDYEKYINSLENQRVNQQQTEYYSDSLEYAEDQDFVGGEYYEEDGNTYVTNNYYNTDDYYYASRIRRFYDPFMTMGYYSSWYYDPFWYQPGWSFRMSYGYPFSSYGFSYGLPGYGYGYPGYGYGYPDYYGYYTGYSSW